MKNKRGFTLIELLVVIGIVIILTGIVVVMINPGDKLADARNSQRKVHVEALYGMIEQYIFHYSGDLPDCFDLKADDEQFDAYDCEVYLTPVFADSLPRDPVDGKIDETGYLLKRDSLGRIGVFSQYAEKEEEIKAGHWE